jgi:hypothetical protein
VARVGALAAGTPDSWARPRTRALYTSAAPVIDRDRQAQLFGHLFSSGAVLDRRIGVGGVWNRGSCY